MNTTDCQLAGVTRANIELAMIHPVRNLNKLNIQCSYLLCHLVLHISLDPPQHKWLENHVQPGQLTLIQCGLLLSVTLNIAREPLVEFLVGVEHGGHDEVEQGPQLLHGVLDWSASQEKTVATVEAKQDSPSHTV